MCIRAPKPTPAVLLLLPLLLLLCLPAWAQDTGFTTALGLMKREQTLGEANAGLLKTFAKDDIPIYARGIQLYAQAQADFNGLIATLKAELTTQGELQGSEEFAGRLQQAAEQRVAFTDFVEDKVLSQTEQGTKSLAGAIGGADVIGDVAELITALTDAGLDIWREYRAADSAHREQILDQLDGLQWRSFEKVPALG